MRCRTDGPCPHLSHPRPDLWSDVLARTLSFDLAGREYATEPAKLDRAKPLSTEVRISDSEEQVLAMADALVADKVKAGWTLVE